MLRKSGHLQWQQVLHRGMGPDMYLYAGHIQVNNSSQVSLINVTHLLLFLSRYNFSSMSPNFSLPLVISAFVTSAIHVFNPDSNVQGRELWVIWHFVVRSLQSLMAYISDTCRRRASLHHFRRQEEGRRRRAWLVIFVCV